MGAAAELQAYIWLYLDQAMDLRFGAIGNALYKLLDHEWPTGPPSTDTFKPRDARALSNIGVGVDYGYDPFANALWFRRDWPSPPEPSTLGETPITPQRLRDLFDTNRDIHKELMRYHHDANGYCAWREQRVQPAFRNRTHNLITQLKVKETAIRRCRGAVVLGASDPLIWIGVTHDEVLIRECDAGIRAARIQRRVERAPSPPTPRAWTALAAADDISDDALRRMALEFVQALFANPSEHHEKNLSYTVVPDIAFANLIGSAVFWCTTKGNLGADLPRLLASLARARPVDWIFVCAASVTPDDVLDAVPTPQQHLGRFLVLDQRRMLDWLGDRPWIWSRHQGRFAFRACRVLDSVDLQDALLPSPLRRHVPVTDEVARALPRIERQHVRITGRPGSGKSTAVYHLLRRDFADAMAIIAAPHLQASDADVIRALVQDAPSIGIPRVVLVIDDLQRYTETAFQLLTWAFATDVSILMTSWSAEEARVAQRFGPWLREEQHISIDAPDRAFIATLLTHCAKSLPDDAVADIKIDALAEIYARRESTPHGIITRFVHGRLLDPTVDDQYWQRAYEAVARERAHDERHILIGLAFLRQAGIPTHCDVLAAVLGVPKLDDHLSTLAANGWLVVHDEQIWIDDVQLLPALGDLWHGQEAIAEYWELFARVRPEELATALPATHPWLAATSLELIARDPDAGDAGMRRYLAAHPDAVHWWHDWVNAHNREPHRAAAILKEGLLTAPGDKEDDDNLIDLAVFLAGTASHGEAIFSMLQELGDAPIGAAVRDAIVRDGNNLARFRLRRLDA